MIYSNINHDGISINFDRINSENLNLNYTVEEIRKIKELADNVATHTIKNKNIPSATRSEIISNTIYGPGLGGNNYSEEIKNMVNNSSNNIKNLIVAYASFPDNNDSFLGKIENQGIDMNYLYVLFMLIENLKKYNLNDEQITKKAQYKMTNSLIGKFYFEMLKYYGTVSPEILLTRANLEYSELFRKKFKEKSTDYKIKFVSEKLKEFKKNTNIIDINIYIDKNNNLFLSYILNSNKAILDEEIITNVEKYRYEFEEYFNNVAFRITCENEMFKESGINKTYKK